MPDILEPEVQVLDSEHKTPPGYEPANAEKKPEVAAEVLSEEKKEADDAIEDTQEESAPSEDEKESGEDSTEEQPKKSKGVQKRIDELTRQRYEAERKEALANQEVQYWKTQAQVKQPEQKSSADTKAPRFEDFDSYDEFVVAQSEYAASKKFEELTKKQREEESKRSFEANQETFKKKVDEAKKKYEDFESVAFASHVPYSPISGQLVMESEMSADIAYYLGKNPDIAKEISTLSPVAAAKAIGRLEVKLSESKPSPKKVTSAPPPVKTVGGSEKSSKDPSQMSNAEYRAWRMKSLNNRR